MWCGVVVVTVVSKVSWDSFSWLIVALVGIIATRTTGDEQPGRGQMDSLSNKINQDLREAGRGPEVLCRAAWRHLGNYHLQLTTRS